MSSYLPVLILYLLSSAVAQFTPTAPGPGDVFKSGSDCLIKWHPDTKTSTWNNVTINLMSGANNAMDVVQLVVAGLDGTEPSLTPYTWTCPFVNPNAAIYFYQFTNGVDAMNSQWTTRFTIASPSGETTPPANTTQPSGDAIPWGHGTTQNATTEGAQSESTTIASASHDSSAEDQQRTGKHDHADFNTEENSQTAFSTSTASASPTSIGMKKTSSTAMSAHASATPKAQAPMVHFSNPSTLTNVSNDGGSATKTVQTIRIVFLMVSCVILQ